MSHQRAEHRNKSFTGMFYTAWPAELARRSTEYDDFVGATGKRWGGWTFFIANKIQKIISHEHRTDP